MIKSIPYMLVFVNSIIIFLGWVFLGTDIEWELYQIGTPQKIYTSFYFIFIALAGLLISLSESPDNKRNALILLDSTKIFSLLTMLAMTILSFGSHIRLNTDFAAFLTFPSVFTLINFVLLCCTFRDNIQKRYSNTNWSWIVFGSSAIALIGYLIGNPYLYFRWDRIWSTGMSAITTLCFLVLSLTILINRKSGKKKLDRLLRT